MQFVCLILPDWIRSGFKWLWCVPGTPVMSWSFISAVWFFGGFFFFLQDKARPQSILSQALITCFEHNLSRWKYLLQQSWIVTLLLFGFPILGMSHLRLTWLCLMSSHRPHQQIWFMLSAGTITSSPSRKAGEESVIFLILSPVPRRYLVQWRCAVLVFQVWRNLWVSMVLQVCLTPPLPPNLLQRMMTMTTSTCLAQTMRLVRNGGTPSRVSTDTSYFKEDEEAARIKEERLAQYAAKKAKSKL